MARGKQNVSENDKKEVETTMSNNENNSENTPENSLDEIEVRSREMAEHLESRDERESDRDDREIDEELLSYSVDHWESYISKNSGSSDLPQPVPTPGWSYRWARMFLGSEIDKANYQKYFGSSVTPWRIVHPSEQPTMASCMAKSNLGEVLQLRDLVLIRAPTKYVIAQQQLQRDNRLKQKGDLSDFQANGVSGAVDSEGNRIIKLSMAHKYEKEARIKTEYPV